MGLLTSLLNPKTAALYLSLLPQFIDRASGEILAQTLTLGALQIAISVCFNTSLSWPLERSPPSWRDGRCGSGCNAG